MTETQDVKITDETILQWHHAGKPDFEWFILQDDGVRETMAEVGLVARREALLEEVLAHVDPGPLAVSLGMAEEPAEGAKESRKPQTLGDVLASQKSVEAMLLRARAQPKELFGTKSDKARA